MPSIRGPADCQRLRFCGQFSGVADGHRAETPRAWLSIQIRTDLPPATVAAQRSGKTRMRSMKKRRYRPARETAPLRPLQIKLANGVEKTHADARALPFGQHHEAAAAGLDDPFPLMPAAHRHMADGLTADDSNIAPCAWHQRHFQIVMRLKNRPKSPAGLVDFKVESGALNPLLG